MSVPKFKDISKKSNDVLSRDFYHLAPLNLEVKTIAPNGVAFAVEGKSNQKNDTLAGKLEAKYADRATGVTLTQDWLTANVLNTKIEVSDAFTPGLDGSVDTSFLPESGAKAAKLSLNFKHPGVNANVVADVFKSAFTGNVVLGQKGFLAGGEFGYDIGKGQMTRYTTQLGYVAPTYSAAIAASNNLSVYTASIYHRVDVATEIGARATWNSSPPASGNVGLEAAVKHALDKSAFVKAKLNNQGVAALSYSQALRPGVTLGVGLEANIQKLSEASHKVGLSLNFVA
ncbi:hypothetical protein EGM85_11895 [Macrococcus caseolyticus]|nr:hypothetical protein [Macrococcus caseolyticus]RKO10310.1 hypothetical protein D6861_11895 [Macrococcus caseolyticus]